MLARLGPLVLASASPRRADLLGRAGYDFEVRPADVDETPGAGEDPLELVLRLAEAKATAGAQGLTAGTVIAGDTVVIRDAEPLGKPDDAAAARRMLRSLAGRDHKVASSTALLHVGAGMPAGSGAVVSGVDVSVVRFASLDEERLETYVAGGEWRGKAGGYAIQGDASAFASVVVGRLDTVIGLSLELVQRLADRLARQVGVR